VGKIVGMVEKIAGVNLAVTQLWAPRLVMVADTNWHRFLF
jgi:hypothetical protein